jgi:hypothetical protein
MAHLTPSPTMPGKSTRQIAEEIGVSQRTVANKRREAVEQNCSTDTVTGKPSHLRLES